MGRCVGAYTSEFIHGSDGIVVLVCTSRVPVDAKINGEQLFQRVKIMKGRERPRDSPGSEETRGIMTTCNVVSWIGSWNRRKLEKSKANEVGSLVNGSAPALIS